MFDGQDDRREKKTGAKQGINTKAGAERRQRQLMSVRHKAHNDAMKMLRHDEEDGAGADNEALVANPTDVWAYNAKSTPASIPLSLLPQFVNMTVNGQTREEVYHGTLMIRKLLSVEKNPPYNQVTESGVVPRLVELLERSDFPELQFEAAWALTNIAAGTSENTVLLVECGAVPRFVALLSSPHADCRDQSAWAIGNLAGEGAACRDEALRHGAMQALLSVLSYPEQPIHVMRNATWAVSNLCRCKPLPALESVAIALPALASLLVAQDEQLVMDSAWGISYISDGPLERVQAVLDAGVVPRIVQLLSSPSTNLKMPAIRTVGNIAAGSDEQTQAIINSGALPAMCELLRHPKRALRKETCWTISNIAAGQRYQVEALVAANVFIPLLECLMAPELDVKKEAVWSVANVTFCGTRESVKYLVNIGVIPPLCDTLHSYDAKIVTVALEALQCFLQTGEEEKNGGATEENIVARQVMDCGGLDCVEQLQNHASRDVYNLAFQILEQFFTVDADVGITGGQLDFENPQVTDKNEGMFNF